MLIGIPPLLGPEFLATLRAMGHGDEIAIVDGNYPALDHARRLVRADGHGVLAVLQAVLTVLPLDRAVPAALFRAALNNDPAQAGDIHREIDALFARLAPGMAV
ncbi:MAG: transporter, partial [Rhodobacterales bacterium 32-66-9]